MCVRRVSIVFSLFFFFNDTATTEIYTLSLHDALPISAEKGLATTAFPAVGTGIAGFPMQECAEIMLREVVEHLKRPTSLKKVYFVLFDKPALEVFERVWKEMKTQGKLDAAADVAGR